MPAAPSFWLQDTWIARALSPLSMIGTALTARRVSRPGWQAPVPVICVGNVTVGGAGKTTLVLDFARRLSSEAVHILSRGYGGSSRGVHRVMPNDPATLVGDEALLLAQAAPTWIGANRAETAKAAIQAGAGILLMDDGLQNPTLVKTFCVLTIDGQSGFGNGRVLPAGPLREPVDRAVERCQAAVIIGPDATMAADRLGGLPILHAALVQDQAIANLSGQRILAFAGIARPEKFFEPLRQAGTHLVQARPFPDHHAFSDNELQGLLRDAQALDAKLVTTPKDAVRLPISVRDKVTIIGVGIGWPKPGQIDELIARMIASGPAPVR